MAKPAKTEGLNPNRPTSNHTTADKPDDEHKSKLNQDNHKKYSRNSDTKKNQKHIRKQNISAVFNYSKI